MLDFGLGGYGIADGMRKEQDRITQNRTTFSNNIANFLANNPYLSPEAVQAYVNAAAGTDNTLRGVIPNQLVGEFNRENARVRRIDTFKAFNEFTRLNPGATAAEFQSAMSALGAQGIYGEDALKAIQGRADQYRKDQETARQMKLAQDIGNTRNSMMSDIEFQASALGYDPVKVTQSLRGIYGDNPPIPYESLINPGSMEVMRTKTIQQYLPEAVKILEANPDLPIELLDGAFPALRGSPIIKSIYDAAKEERRKAIENKFYSLENRKKVVDAVTNAYSMGLDPQTTLTESLRGIGIRPEDMSGLDTSSIMAEAKAFSDKSKSDEKTKLDDALAGAKGKMFESIRTNTLADPTTLQTLANGDIGAVESFVRARIRDESGLSEEMLAKIPNKYYSDLAQSIRQQIIANASIEQKKLYDTVVGSEGKIRTGLVEKSVEAAKNFSSTSAVQQIKNAGLEQSVAGAAIPTIMLQLAQQYDVTGVNGTRVFNYLISAAQKEPDADMATLLGSVPAELLVPINDIAQRQVEQMKFDSGALSDKPIRATDYVAQTSRKIYSTAQNTISTVIEVSKKTDLSVEDRILALQEIKQGVLRGVVTSEENYQASLGFTSQWDYNDRLSNFHVASLSNELRTNAERVINLIDSSLNVLQQQSLKEQQANLAPAEVFKTPASPDKSDFYNTVIAPFSVTPEKATISMMRDQILRNMPADPGLLGGIFSSSRDREIAQRLMDVTQSRGMMALVYNEPELWALINPESRTRDPARFIEELKKRGYFAQPQE